MTTSLSSHSLKLISSHKVWDTQITLVSIASVMNRALAGTAKEKRSQWFVKWVCMNRNISVVVSHMISEWLAFILQLSDQRNMVNKLVSPKSLLHLNFLQSSDSHAFLFSGQCIIFHKQRRCLASVK